MSTIMACRRIGGCNGCTDDCVWTKDKQFPCRASNDFDGEGYKSCDLAKKNGVSLGTDDESSIQKELCAGVTGTQHLECSDTLWFCVGLLIGLVVGVLVTYLVVKAKIQFTACFHHGGTSAKVQVKPAADFRGSTNNEDEDTNIEEIRLLNFDV